jgi:hypothetical protein
MKFASAVIRSRCTELMAATARTQSRPPKTDRVFCRSKAVQKPKAAHGWRGASQRLVLSNASTGKVLVSVYATNRPIAKGETEFGSKCALSTPNRGSEKSQKTSNREWIYLHSQTVTSPWGVIHIVTSVTSSRVIWNFTDCSS